MGLGRLEEGGLEHMVGCVVFVRDVGRKWSRFCEEGLLKDRGGHGVVYNECRKIKKITVGYSLHTI